MTASALQRPLAGVAMALAAAVLWGTTGTAQRLAAAQASPYWIGALRLLAAALFFWLLAAARGRNASMARGRKAPFALEEAPIARAAWPAIAAAGGCMAAYNLAFFAGVSATGVAVGTAVAIGSGPVWAGLLQWAVLRHSPAPLWWVGTLLAVAGGALLVFGVSDSTSAGGASAQPIDRFGLALCLAAGFSYAAYTLLCQALVRDAPPGAVTRWVFSIAAVVALPLAAGIGGAGVHGVAGWLGVAYLGVVATGVAYLLFSHALRHIGGATAVTLALAEPVTAFALAIAVVGERPGASAFAGLGLVLAGLLFVVWTETGGAGRRSCAEPAA